MKAKIVLASCVLSLFMGPAAQADSGKIVATQNISEICNLAPVTHRKTIVYIDLSSVRKDEQEWGLTLVNKLELAPREALTILGVNPGTFEVTEVFDSCYPTLQKSELELASKNRSYWDALTKLGPDEQQRENIETYNASLRSALNKLVDAAGKFSLGKRRDILGAVAIDKNRFEDHHSFYRLIIYTNASIAEPEFTDKEPKDQIIRLLNEKYAASFSGADIYVYGVAGIDRSLETQSAIFSAFFLKNWGWLRSFAPSLPPQQPELIQSVTAMSGNFQGGGAQGSVYLAYATGKGSELKEAWLSFVVGTSTLYVPFEGTVSCEGDTCTLRAVCLEDIPVGSNTPYFRKGDKLILSGKKADGDWNGSLKPSAPEVFKAAQDLEKKDAVIDPKKLTQVDYSLTLHRN